MHDPCFIARGALREQAQFVTCPHHTLKTSFGGRFVSGIFVGIQKKKPVSILGYPNGLLAWLFCFWWCESKEGRKTSGKLAFPAARRAYNYGGSTGKCNSVLKWDFWSNLQKHRLRIRPFLSSLLLPTQWNNTQKGNLNICLPLSRFKLPYISQTICPIYRFDRLRRREMKNFDKCTGQIFVCLTLICWCFWTRVDL